MAKAAKMDIPPGFLFFPQAPNEFRDATIAHLRSGRATREFLNFVADLIDPKKATHYRLHLKKRYSGNPQSDFNYKLYHDIDEVMSSFQSQEKISASRILLKASQLGIELKLNDKLIDVRAINRYVKLIKEFDAVNAEIWTDEIAIRGSSSR